MAPVSHADLRASRSRYFGTASSAALLDVALASLADPVELEVARDAYRTAFLHPVADTSTQEFANGVASFYAGPIEVNDPDGTGGIAVKLGTVQLTENRRLLTVAAFAPSHATDGNVADFMLVVVPEGVDPFDADVLTGQGYPSIAIPFDDAEEVTGALIARPADQPVLLAGDLTAPLSAAAVVDVYLTHPDAALPESLALADGVEVYLG